MSMNRGFENLGIVGIIVGVVGAAVGGWQTYRTNKIAKKMDVTLEDLEKKTPVDIREDLVAKATMRAIEKQVAKFVEKTAQSVGEDIRGDMDSMIRKDVDRVYGDLKDSVQERVSEEIASLDYDELREEIQRKAEHKVFEEIRDVISTAKIFGNAATGRGFDFDGLAKVADKLPWSERGDFLTSAVKSFMR